MKEIEREASVNHVEKAMDVLQTLQTENETGEFHRDFMQARLKDVEQREALLKEELARCEAERNDINKHSHDVGYERMHIRNNLARAAFQLLANENGTIKNRSLLWKIVAEQKLAHYEKADAKERYAVMLDAIDSTLRDAHAKNITHPVLVMRHDAHYTDDASELYLHETDVESDGVAGLYDRSALVGLRDTTSSNVTQSLYDNKSDLEIPRFGLINYYEPSGRVITTELDASVSYKTDLVIGAESLSSYFDLCLSNNPTLLKTQVKQLTHQLRIRRSEPLTELAMQHAIGEHISRFSTDEFISELGKKRLTLDTVADANYLIRSPDDRQRVIDSVNQLANPQLQRIIMSLM
jgi:hypothetical protein